MIPNAAQHVPVIILTCNNRKVYTIEHLSDKNNIIVIKDTDKKGIHNARQNVIKFAKKNGYNQFWMLDDDLTHFYRNNSHYGPDGKTVELVKKTEVMMDFSEVDTHNFAVASLMLSAFNIFRDKNHIKPAWRFVQCVYLDLDQLDDFNYCDQLTMNEDIYLSLWAYERGLPCGSIASFSYDCKPTGPRGKQSTFTNEDWLRLDINSIYYLLKSDRLDLKFKKSRLSKLTHKPEDAFYLLDDSVKEDFAKRYWEITGKIINNYKPSVQTQSEFRFGIV